MKLIIDKNAESIHDSFGISDMRSDELKNMIDTILEEPQLKTAIMAQQVVAKCDNLAEIAFALLYVGANYQLKRYF